MPKIRCFMAMPNYTREEESKPIDLPALVCSADIAEGIHGPLLFFSILNTFLSITAFLGNALILIALHKESTLHAPSKLLFRTLATSDLCVGITLEPLFVVSWILMITECWNICRYTIGTGFLIAYILGCVSLTTISAISVDRLLALLLRLKYRQVVTLQRTYAMVISIWLMGIGVTAMSFLDYLLTTWIGYIGILLGLLTSGFCYAWIFVTLRSNQRFVRPFHANQSQQSEGASPNVARYRKTVYSALWVQATLVICYLPYIITGAIVTHGQLNPSVYLAWTSAGTLVFLNSMLNPILYCWKMREVKQAVKDILRQSYRLFQCFSQLRE
ncbi:adrenocorticotropic hormone receptor-like [Montipora capricornis]|uniref:adrenocorticotropic hormone receptor-like n=1 Tax=Montipora capricornis TaxID=246305 RepID=UPI0035F10B06